MRSSGGTEKNLLVLKFSANSDGRNTNGAFNKLHVLAAKLANRAESAAQVVSHTNRLLTVEFLLLSVHMFGQLLFVDYPGAHKRKVKAHGGRTDCKQMRPFPRL